MRPEAIIRMLEDVGAIRQGHFELTSGLHSATYVQCAQVLQYPKYAEQLGGEVASEFMALRGDWVASPALGGLIIGREVAHARPPRADGTPVRAIFVERDATGSLTLRRGFRVDPDEHVLVVEDVWTTGGSTYSTIRVLEEAGARVVAAGALIDRSGGQIELPVRTEALMDLKVESYDQLECPLCLSGSGHSMRCCSTRSGLLRPSRLRRTFMPGGTPWQKLTATEFFAGEWSLHFSGGTCSMILFRWILTPWLKPRGNLKGSTISHRSRHPPVPKTKIAIER